MVSQGLLTKGLIVGHGEWEQRSWSRRLLVATQTEGVLGLIHHGLVVLVGVGGARGLVSGSLTGRLLIIRNDVAMQKSVNEYEVRDTVEWHTAGPCRRCW